jgi:hypothetical protein
LCLPDGVSPARNPGAIDSLEAIEALRRRHAEELQWVVQQEQMREKARCTMLAAERSAKRCKHLSEVIERERQQVCDCCGVKGSTAVLLLLLLSWY